MRLVACITRTSVIDQTLTHLRTRASREAHAGPRDEPAYADEDVSSCLPLLFHRTKGLKSRLTRAF